MSGYTPIPNERVPSMIDALKKINRRMALELWILHKTCRRDGWDGLRPGQVRVSITDAANLLGCARGNACHLLCSIMQDWGLTKASDSILEWPEITAALTAAPTATQEALILNTFVRGDAAPTAALTAAPSITRIQESKERQKRGRSAPLSPQDEKTMEEGLTILRENYSKVYHDGEPSPVFSRSLTIDRIRALAPAHGVMPLLMAMERYYEENTKAYFKAPQNLLGPKGPWRDYMEEA